MTAESNTPSESLQTEIPSANQSTESQLLKPDPEPIQEKPQEPQKQKRIPGLRRGKKRGPKGPHSNRPTKATVLEFSGSDSGRRADPDPDPDEDPELLFDFFDPEFLAPTIVLLVNAIISRAKKEPLNEKEEKAVVRAVSATAKKRLSSEWLKQYGDLVNLGVVLGGVALKRVDLEKLMKGPAEAEEMKFPRAI